jgi:RNA polymerase sigma-70 factor (ECF subfamily)
LQRTPDDVLAFLEENGGRLYAVLLRLTLRHDVADDLMQELFIRVIRGGIGRARDPVAYAMRTATNLALDWRRAQARRREMSSTCETLDALRSENHVPLSQLVNREETERVLDAVSELPSQGREIVVMYYLEQQSFEVIGQQLDRTAHHVRAMCHKAMKRLRLQLGVKSTFLNQVGDTCDEP